MRRDLGIDNDRVVLLFSGKLSIRKGTHVLVEAVKHLPCDLRERVVVMFLGDGSERQKLTDLAGLEPAIRVVFVGFKNQTELSPYYHAADMLVLPSMFSETWGLVVNEALHHGVPCVVTDQVGCAPDLVEPGVTGEIAQAGSAESLAEALQRARCLVGKEETAAACRQKVAGYTVHAAAEGIARAYWSVCGSTAIPV
jgi:glycosyltransferase involved in cell wall biosynthesis